MLNQANESLTHFEPHNNKTNKKLNWLRASVLGANDGIVSTASIIVGVAGASSDTGTILTAGVAGMVLELYRWVSVNIFL